VHYGLGSGRGFKGSNERRKSFSIVFNAKWSLEIQFLIEKKRVNTSLLDLAAEAVALRIKDRNDVVNLEVPVTLFDNVYDKFSDVKWIRSYWNFEDIEIEQVDDAIEDESTRNVEVIKDTLENAAVVNNGGDDQESEVDEFYNFDYWNIRVHIWGVLYIFLAICAYLLYVQEACQ